MIAGGNVKAPIAAAQSPGAGLAVVDVTVDALVIKAGQTAQITRGTDQSFDPVSAGDKFMDKIRPNKTRCARNETIHREGHCLELPKLKSIEQESLK